MEGGRSTALLWSLPVGLARARAVAPGAEAGLDIMSAWHVSRGEEEPAQEEVSDSCVL